ncbi:cytochrome c family protein [Cupriavidus sp. USMAA2-4]|uniref:Cytochrome c family protein n=1 Tax=Cupriavidus malaysiensis TaxID=367825 RepID=A0ABM6FBN2_9BURK|nr:MULTISPECIES: cytochrome c family protein [Cupriavidus]AOY96030.1 cytochrome c family protein [Cupriavidus sp. USMAA2-4]AOZ03535.1 cytochrome c family protein [Cupriavidus sp. USMAHM13]AOZ09103.1 cytochrome c family protein [Cupriavidus malaysiensis]
MRHALLCALILALPPAAHAAGDALAGKALFTTRCASCHSVGPSARGAFGPQLNGLFGRHAGSTTDYQYSAAMKASGIVWTDATLSAFIQSPDKVVPGTRMRFWGIGNAQQIENLLAYLRTFR